MSVWRIKRQFNYFLITLLFFFLIGGVVYLIYRPSANCFDGRKNQDEEDIDCGGSCQRLCLATVLPLKVLWVQPFEISAGSYTAVALVENENLSAGVKNLSYTIKLLDQSGKEVVRRVGTTKVFSSERLAILESNIETGRQSITRAFIEFSDPIFWEKLVETKPLLRVSKTGYVNEPVARLSALAVNETNNDLKNVRVMAILADSSGNAYTASATLISDFPKQSSREIFFTWPKTLTQPTFVDFYTRVLGDDF